MTHTTNGVADRWGVLVKILVKSQQRELQIGRDIGKWSTKGVRDRWGYW